MKGIARKSLVSVVAAGLLSTAAFAVKDVVDQTDAANFRIVVDKSKVEQNKNVVVTIDLVKEDGSLDRNELLYGNNVQVNILSSLGNNITTIDGNLGDGTAVYKIKESTLGTDTIGVGIVIKDAEGDAKVLPAKSINVEVVPPVNQAKGLEILSLSPSTVKDGASALNFDGNYSKGTPKILAGDSFTVKVEAIQTDDNESNNAFEEAQNSEVTLRIIGIDAIENEGGNKVIDSGEVNKTLIATFKSEMKNGLAYINVPAEAIKEAGYYKLQVVTPTDNPAVPADDNGIRWARSSAEYNLSVIPLGPDHIALGSDKDFIVRTADGNTTNASLTISLVDKYNNLARKSKITNDIQIALEASNAVNIDGAYQTKTSTITKNNNWKNLPIAVSSSRYSELSVDDTTKVGTTTIQVTSNNADLGNGDGINLSIYTHRIFIDTNETANNINTPAVNTPKVAGAKFSFEEQNATDGPFALVFKGNGTGVEDIHNKPIIVTIKNRTTSQTDSVNTLIKDDNTTEVKFTKAGTYDRLIVEYAASNGTQYAPLILDLPENNTSPSGNEVKISTITIKPADASKLELYKINPELKYYAVENAKKAVSEITVDKYADNGKLYFDTNETNVTNNSATKKTLYVRLEDMYQNKITDGTQVSLISSLLGDKTLTIDGSDVKVFDYSTKTAPQQDSITLAAALVDSKDLTVNYVDNTPKLTKIEPDFESNAVLVGSLIPFSVAAYDQFDKPLQIDSTSDAAKKLQIVIGDPAKIKVYELNSTNGLEEVNSGADINTSRTYFVKGLSLGNTDITIRNIAGTLTKTQSISVVGNLEELAQAESSSSTSSSSSSSTNPITAVEDAIAAASPVEVDGYYMAYDFNGDGTIEYNDWAYKVASTGHVYRLLGVAPTDDNPFGWAPANVTVDEANADWLMAHYGAGRYDWVVFKPDCSAIYKLAGATAQGTFSYDVDGDGQADKLTDLTCTVQNGQVTFSKNQ